MHPRLIIFDYDGTLVDSETLANQVWVDLAADHGVTLTLAEALQRFKGGTMAECLTELERRIGRALPEDIGVKVRRRRIENRACS
jgi:beta-phosphoglucomutase-like phosphatase (HAD superfamily)